MKTIKFILLTAIMMISVQVFAQEKFYLAENNSTLKIEGTSSLHDWEMKAEEFDGSASVIREGSDIKSFSDAKFSFKAESVISDNSIMNSKAHDALKVKKHPEINFSLSSIKNIRNSGNEFSGTLNGKLSMAGETKEITVPFEGKLNSDDSIIVKGSKKLRMSDFDIDPPTAMLGTLKTGDEITINYVFELTKQDQLTNQ